MWRINKKRLIIFLAVIIVLSAGGISVAAYNSTSIECEASIRIVAPDQALLALEPGNDPAGNMVIEQDGVLDFSFAFDDTYEQYYEFTELIKVHNHSADNIAFSVESQGIDYITIAPRGSGDYFIEDGLNTGYYHPLVSGESTYLSVSFDVPAHHEEQQTSGILTVRAQITD